MSDGDIADLLYLSDLQARHMAHNAKESRGAGYDDENLLRCGVPALVKLNKLELDMDDFNPADYTDVKRLDKYTGEYNFTPMGVSDALWFYFDGQVVCGMRTGEYAFTTVPGGVYAMVTVSSPFTFSAMRVWDYVCLWTRKNNVAVTSVDIGGEKTNMFVKFYRQGMNQYMEMFVPVKCRL